MNSVFLPTHIAAMGNSQDSPRIRILVRVLRASDLPRFFVCEDADGVLYRFADQNLSPVPKNEPTTTKPTIVVEPPTPLPTK